MSDKVDLYRIDEIADNNDANALSNYLFHQSIKLRFYALAKLSRLPISKNDDVLLVIRDYLHVEPELIGISVPEFEFFHRVIALLFKLAFEKCNLSAKGLILHLISPRIYRLPEDFDLSTGFDMNNFIDEPPLVLFFYNGLILEEIRKIGFKKFCEAFGPLPFLLEKSLALKLNAVHKFTSEN